jgi:hypothetical protein
VLYDNLDPLLIATFEAQPSGLTVTQALRAAMHEVFGALPPAEVEDVRDHLALIASARF